MASSNKSDKKGFGFEYSVSHMFQSQGYLSRRGIPLQYGSGNHDATDIDVLGIMFTSPFQGHRIICDCKNKVRSKPYERIFWAKGLGEFVNASNVFVALPKTQWEIIKFASTGNVKVLSGDILSEYTTSTPFYGLADASYYEEYEAVVKKVAKTDLLANKILANAKKLYLEGNPYLALNIALADLERISKSFKYLSTATIEQIMTLKYLASELTVIVGLQLLWICSDVLGLPEQARREHITSKLTFGELEPEIVKGIMKDAEDLANEIIKTSVPKSIAPKKVDFGEITAPSYTDSLIGLVDRALARPQMYLTMPQYLDFLLFEQGLKGIEYSDEEFIKKFGYSKVDEKVKAAKNILSFVRDSCGIDWGKIWGKNDDQSLQISTKITKAPQQKKKVEVPETLQEATVNKSEKNEDKVNEPKTHVETNEKSSE